MAKLIHETQLDRCECGHLRLMHETHGNRKCTVTPADPELAAVFGATTSKEPCNCWMYQRQTFTADRR